MLKKFFTYWPYIIFLFLSFLLTLSFFYGVQNNHFLYVHDQFFRFNYNETFVNSFFLRKPADFSILNSWQQMTQFWDMIFYLIVYSIGLSMEHAEKILFFLVLLETFVLSFNGFQKVCSLFDNKIDTLKIVVVTVWFAINPYTLILWHTGNYNLGSALTYSLIPLILYYYHKSVLTKFNLREVLILSLLLFLASPVFWLFAVVVFLLILYTIIYLLFHIHSFFSVLKNIAWLAMFYIPTVSFVLFTILYEFFNNTGDNNAVFLPTYGLQQGGLAYQALMLFSWAIYTPWTPRSLFPFDRYFFSEQYIFGTLAIYFLVIIGISLYVVSRFVPFSDIKQRITKIRIEASDFFLFAMLVILTASIFFAKADQPPLGRIFRTFYEHVPFFTIFRSADVRFGYLVVLSLSFLLIFCSKFFNKFTFALVMICVIFSQSVFLLNGDAVKGENKGNMYYDRVAYYTNSHREVINYLNQQNTYGYVLSLPAAEFGHFSYYDEHFIGQDFLAKMIQTPFVNSTSSGGMYQKSYQKLEDALKEKNFEALNALPIQYILLRRDIVCTECTSLSEAELSTQYRQVLKNDLYTLYETTAPSVISAFDLQITQVNPIKYIMHVNNLSSFRDIDFLVSYNKDWKLYITEYREDACAEYKITGQGVKTCSIRNRFIEGDEFSYLWRTPIFESTHSIANGYANKWNIDRDVITSDYDSSYYYFNPNQSINARFVIYFQPQSWYYLFILVSIVTIFFEIGYIVINRNKLPK